MIENSFSPERWPGTRTGLASASDVTASLIQHWLAFPCQKPVSACSALQRIRNGDVGSHGLH